jgi:predicted transposase/invertase (TIGR01784 family)
MGLQLRRPKYGTLLRRLRQPKRIVMDKLKILPVKSDIIFRLFFADERNQEFLVSFLQSVLNLPDEDYDEIEISDPYLLREYPGDKLWIVDIKLKTKSKKIIHIEIQLSVAQGLKSRIIYYMGKLVTEQLGSGMDFDMIKRVISIIITDEELLASSDKYHHRFLLYEPESGMQFSDLVEINTLELCKLPSQPDGTKLYDWAKFIAAETVEELDEVAKRNEEVEKAVVKVKVLTGSERAKELHESRQKYLWDLSLHKKEGIRQGMEQGMEYAKLEIAKTLLSLGDPPDKIAAATGLTYEEIESLQSGAQAT